MDFPALLFKKMSSFLLHCLDLDGFCMYKQMGIHGKN